MIERLRWHERRKIWENVLVRAELVREKKKQWHFLFSFYFADLDATTRYYRVCVLVCVWYTVRSVSTGARHCNISEELTCSNRSSGIPFENESVYHIFVKFFIFVFCLIVFTYFGTNFNLNISTVYDKKYVHFFLISLISQSVAH